MSEVVDPRRGIDVVDSENGGSDEPIPPPHKLCGAEAFARAKERVTNLVEHDARSQADQMGPSLSCGPLSCAKAPRMEYDVAIQVRFQRIDGALRLVSFDAVDVLLRDPAAVAADRNRNDRALARLALSTCK